MINFEQYIQILEVSESSYTRSLINTYSILEDIDIMDAMKTPMRTIRESVIGFQTELKRDLSHVNLDKDRRSLFKMSLNEYIELDKMIEENDYEGVIRLVYDLDEEFDLREIEWTYIKGYREIIDDKKKLLDSFPNLFEEPFDFDEEMKKENLDEGDKKIIIEEKKKYEFRKQYNWDLLLLHLSNRDITKIEKILDMNIVMIFRLLTAREEYDKMNETV